MKSSSRWGRNTRSNSLSDFKSLQVQLSANTKGLRDNTHVTKPFFSFFKLHEFNAANWDQMFVPVLCVYRSLQQWSREVMRLLLPVMARVELFFSERLHVVCNFPVRLRSLCWPIRHMLRLPGRDSCVWRGGQVADFHVQIQAITQAIGFALCKKRLTGCLGRLLFRQIACARVFTQC